MAQNGVWVGLLVSTLICFGIPIGGCVILRHYGKKIIKPFLLGALTFFVSQVILRIPIINYILPYQRWYIVLSYHTVLYSVFLGLTAGLFEEIGRFLCMKYLLKSYREIDGFAFGLGHGGIEAILFVGINYLVLLISMIMVKLGFVNTLSQIFGNVLSDQLISTIKSLSAYYLLLGGLERMIAMGLHVGMSMIVLHGLKNKKPIRYLAAAILIHTIADSSIGIFKVLGLGAVSIEIFNLIIVGILIVYTIYSVQKKSIKKKGNNIK